MFVMSGFVHRDGTWYANRLAALPRRKEVHDFPIDHEHVDGSAGGSHFPAIVKNEVAGVTFIDQHECAAANSRALWFNKSKDGMGGNTYEGGNGPAFDAAYRLPADPGGAAMDMSAATANSAAGFDGNDTFTWTVVQ